jgi:hypothetical protein
VEGPSGLGERGTRRQDVIDDDAAPSADDLVPQGFDHHRAGEVATSGGPVEAGLVARTAGRLERAREPDR